MFSLGFREDVFVSIRRKQYLSDKNFLIFYCLSWRNDTIRVELVDSLFINLALFRVRFAYLSHASVCRSDVFFTFISSVENTSEHTSLNGTLVHNNGVLLVVTCETSHGYDWVATHGQFFHWNVFCGFCDDQWSLWVVHQVGQGLHTDLVVWAVQAHCLFWHGTLQSVLGSLVVIGEWNDWTGHSEQHWWVNLAVSVTQFLILLQISQIHSNQTVFFLLNIQILNQTLLSQIVKTPFTIKMLKFKL